MANASYDTLTISINADSKQANTNINKLSSNLQKLDKTAKELDDKRIVEVKELLLDIANIDFSNVSKGLQDVVKAFNAFNSKKFMGATNNGSNLSGAYIPKPTSFASTENLLKGLDITQSKFDAGAIVQSFRDARIEALNASVATGEWLNNLKEANEELQEGETGGADFAKSLSKVVFQFKNILKYRIIRKIIQDIYKAIQEGFESVLQFDTGLQKVFNNFRDSFKFLTDSMGALVSPLAQILLPALTALVDVVANLGNELAKMFATLNGQDGYAKAIKGTKDWVSEMKKTQSTGIDELNVLNQDNKGGNFEWVETLAHSGVGLGKILADVMKLLNPILDIIITILDSLSPVFDIVLEIFDFISPAINFFVERLGVAFEALALIFKLVHFNFDDIGSIWDKLLDHLKHGFVNLIEFFAGLLDKFVNFFANILDTIGKAFGGGFEWRSNLAGNVRDWGNSFAMGGFPEDGLFFANHNELVGQFSNGQTAVANNEQITQGIYQAVLQAMRESGGDRGDVVVNLDGYEIARVVTKKQNNMGQNMVFGGNVNYGK